MRKLWFFTVLLAMPLGLWAQGPAPLVKVKVGRSIKLMLPQNMRPMSKEEINNKYLSSRAPLAMYTTQDSRIDFGIKTSNSRFATNDLPLAAQFYRANLVGLYDSVNFLREEIEVINDRQFLVFEFNSMVMPEEGSLSALVGNSSGKPVNMYTYIQYTLVNNQVVVFNFSCPQVYQDKWRTAAWHIMHSLKIKKTL